MLRHRRTMPAFTPTDILVTAASMRLNMRRLLIPALLILQATAHAAVPQAEPSATPAAAAKKGNQELDEVVVRGTRLSELRSAIVKAEDRFYARYNEINQIRDFDIDCIMDAPTGMKKKFRRCRTHLEVRARTEEAGDILERLQRHTSVVDGGDPVSARTVSIDIMSAYAGREEQFRQHFLKLVNTHPELRALLNEREEAEARYERERARRSRGRLIAW